MPRSAEYAKVHLDAGEEPAPSAVADSDTPFRILLVGDFSGRAARGIADATLKGRRPIMVDRDNFDQVMERLEVGLPSIRFAELDDFHPDRLYEQLPVFRTLRDTRERLSDRATFATAAAEVRSWTPARPAPAPKPAPTEPDLGRLTPDQLFSRMLEETAPAEIPLKSAPDPFDLLLRDIVAPHLEPKPDPKQGELLAQVDETIGAQMRAILHHPEFQAVEAAWRGLFFLVRRLETGTGLKLYILDVTRDELAGFAAAKDITETGLYDIVVEQTVGTPGAEPWALLAGNFTFDSVPDDLILLRELGRLARAAGAPFIAGGSTRIFGCESLDAQPDPRAWKADEKAALLWGALRRVPEAEWVGLATPGFLLRLPYGEATNSAERFDFEEMPSAPRHDTYLWGNPVFACVCLLGQGFGEYGWDFRADAYHQIEGLPAHLYKSGGESVLKPCAEALLTERAAQAIIDQGLMALVSIKGSDRVQLLRFQSIAKPGAALPGRWGR